MLKVAFVIYREWGYEIFKNILTFQKQRKDFILDTLIVPQSEKFTIAASIKNGVAIYSVDPKNTIQIYEILKTNKIDIVCLYSWSWIVKKPILTDFICLCLHPSPLPKYRGGTPIQNQIINGEEKSAVSIFKMSEGIDDGPIYKQTPISFLGDVNDIFARMIDAGTIMTKQLLEDALTNKLSFKPQKNLSKNPPYKRRTPAQSEINKAHLSQIKYMELYNLIRGLLDPYPNVFMTVGRQKIAIFKITKYKYLPSDAVLLENKNIKNNQKNVFIKLKDSYAKLLKYKVTEI